MAIFDEHKVMYLTFYIELKDRDRVAELQAEYPEGVNRAIYNPSVDGSGIPGGAAVEFDAPFRGYVDPGAGFENCCWTPWAADDEGDVFPINVATFRRHTGGHCGIGGTTVRYYWIGEFVLRPDPVKPWLPTPGPPVEVDAQALIPKRRWVEGFEAPGLGASGYIGDTGFFYARDASRHVGGVGLAYRGGAAGQVTSIATQKYDGALVAASSWERLYIRLRQTPTTGTVEFWRCYGFPNAANGWTLGITPARQIAIYSSDSGSVRSLLGTYGSIEEWTEQADHHAWVRLDMLIEYLASNSSRFRLFMRGQLVATLTSANGGTRHQSSYIGNTASTTNDLYLDFDDWMNAA
jgi:hypothetical protein